MEKDTKTPGTKLDQEYMFCGFCVGSITDCEKMFGEYQKTCEKFSYHGGSPLGQKRLLKQ